MWLAWHPSYTCHGVQMMFFHDGRWKYLVWFLSTPLFVVQWISADQERDGRAAQTKTELKCSRRTIPIHQCQTADFWRQLGMLIVGTYGQYDYLWIELVIKRSAVCDERFCRASYNAVRRGLKTYVQEAHLERIRSEQVWKWRYPLFWELASAISFSLP